MPDPAQSQRPVVLIVEDDATVLEGNRRLLHRAGFRAFAVRCGADAESLLKQTHVDALVLDYQLPDVRGDVFYWLAVALQEHLRRRTIFITGDITAQVETAIAETGCQQLAKPYDVPAFIEAVRTLLRDDDDTTPVSNELPTPNAPQRASG